MVYNNMDSRVTSLSGCLLLLGRRLVVLFTTAAVSVAQRHNGMESQLVIFFSPQWYEFESRNVYTFVNVNFPFILA